MDRSLRDVVDSFRRKPSMGMDRISARRVLSRLIALGLLTALGSSPALAQGTLRIGMTAADIPLDDRPARPGLRRLPLRRLHDLRRADELGPLVGRQASRDSVPGLATEWKVDDDDKTKWVFKLREGVKFHDGTDFNADAVVWNLDKLLERQVAAIRPEAGGPGALAHSDAQVATRRSTTTRSRSRPRARTPSALPDRLLIDVEPGAVGEGRQGLGEVRPRRRRAPARGRSTASCRASAPSCAPQQGLLGQGARSEARQAGAAPDAGGGDPHRRAAARARSTGSRRRRPTPSRSSRQGGFKIVTNTYPHNWAVQLSMRRGLAVDRHPRAQGGQPRDRPRRPQEAARTA